MKTTIIKRLICSFLSAEMMIVCAMPVLAWDIDRQQIDLSFENAPEGTVYIDILAPVKDVYKFITDTHDIQFYVVKDKWDSKKQRSEFEKSEFYIDKDSEIARYFKDGYISISANTSLVRYYRIYENYSKDGKLIGNPKPDLYLSESAGKNGLFGGDTSVDVYDLMSMVSELRAAYIDDKGNVLGVTDKFVKTENENLQFTFKADGDTLTYIKNSTDEKMFWTYFGGMILLICLYIILPLLVIIIFIKWIVQGVKSSK